MNKQNISILLLAAGSSTRMGRSKQLLQVHGQPLLRKTAKAAVSSNAKSVLVVLGDNSAAHAASIQDLPVTTVVHDRWHEGMGSSLKRGLKEIIASTTGVDAVLILVCDQPAITAGHLNTLMQMYSSGTRPIVVSAYNGVIGVPAVFSKKLFNDLLALNDSHGARKIAEAHPGLVESVPFAGGEVDLDTPEDYEAYLRTLNNA